MRIVYLALNFVSTIFAVAFLSELLSLVIAVILFDGELRGILGGFSLMFTIFLAMSPLPYVYISLIAFHFVAIIYTLCKDKKLAKANVIHSVIIVMFILYFNEQSQNLSNLRAM